METTRRNFAEAAPLLHDFVILLASIRHDGKSLVEIAGEEISKPSGRIASLAVVIILVVALAGLGSVVVNALAESSWGMFTIAATIPIALLMGVWMFRFRAGKTGEATVIGVILLFAAVVGGRYVPGSAIGQWLLFSKKGLTVILALYGFIASVLPVWLLLSPRDYLSSIMKLGVVALLALGIIMVAPNLHMPAFTSFVHGGGPVIPGTLYPYLFITIACGAISGFHSLVSSGTTPKMLNKESDMLMISSGAMLAEAMVSILALLAASSLLPLDYFRINVPADKLALFMDQLHHMGFTTSNLTGLSQEVGENIQGRTGGAVSLAVGMAQIFSSVPGLKGLMSYWYHFAIMFEALFILTTIDAGTRIGRFILQEAFGHVYKPLGKTNSWAGNLAASGLFVIMWGYFIYTGSVATIWPMFGAANQLLAAIALVVGTSYLINQGKLRYAWTTAIPMVFVGVTTIAAGILNMKNIYIPQLFVEDTWFQGLVNLLLTLIIMTSVIYIFIEACRRWIRVIRTETVSKEPVLSFEK